MGGSPFITFRDTDKNSILRYYILQRDYPHYCGLISEKQDLEALVQFPVSGYNLWVIYAGTIRGNYVPGYKDAFDEMSHVFNHMAMWYYENRITPDPKRYKKWAIPVS